MKALKSIFVLSILGFFFASESLNAQRVVVSTDIYFYHSGNFYIQDDRQYKIVEPPLYAIVYDLPTEAEKVKVNGETYYQYNETLYQKVKTVGGKGYKVVGGLEA